MSQVYTIRCPACEQQMELEPGMMGTQFECPNCKKEIQAPKASSCWTYRRTTTGLESKLRGMGIVWALAFLILAAIAVGAAIGNAMSLWEAIPIAVVSFFTGLAGSFVFHWMAELLAASKKRAGISYDPNSLSEHKTETITVCRSCSKHMAKIPERTERCPACGAVWEG